jgi:hypothetical protein
MASTTRCGHGPFLTVDRLQVTPGSRHEDLQVMRDDWLGQAEWPSQVETHSSHGSAAAVFGSGFLVWCCGLNACPYSAAHSCCAGGRWPGP